MRVSRVLQGGSLDLALTTSGTTVTVDVTNDAGTALDTAAPATVANGQAVYTVNAPAELDRLTVTWTVDGAFASTEIVEVVGGFIFTVADARQLKPFDDVSKWPDATIEALRVLVEQALEDACNGFAFVPRYAHELVDGSGTAELFLPHPNARAVRSVTMDDTAFDADTLARVIPTPEGTLYRKPSTAGKTPYPYDHVTPDVWTLGRLNVDVAYEHGLDAAPGRVPHAALKVLRHLAVDSPISDRAVSLTNSDGTYQTVVTAGVRGAVFSVPDANVIVAEYRDPTIA